MAALLCTVEEAAELMGYARPTLYSFIRSGAFEAATGIEPRRIGRTIRIPRVPLERWLNGLPPVSPDPTSGDAVPEPSAAHAHPSAAPDGPPRALGSGTAHL